MLHGYVPHAHASHRRDCAESVSDIDDRNEEGYAIVVAAIKKFSDIKSKTETMTVRIPLQ